VVWIPIGAWIAAAVVAIVVLGFCGYEIGWKTKRLRRDLRELERLAGQLSVLRGQLARTQERIAASGLR
jgi:hypothetical protein